MRQLSVLSKILITGEEILRNPDVSICIVNYNTKELLYKCINSIKKNSSRVEYEIIVVDNGSQDGSVEMMRKEWPDCKLIESSNVGFARGCNVGMRESRGEYVLFLNPDTELVTNALKGMLAYLEENLEYAAVGCRLISRDGSIQYECARAFPTVFNEICYFFVFYKPLRKNKLFCTSEMEFWDHRNSRSVECISGACMMIRRNILEEMGGFDENTFMYSEDVDLCYRILRNGWKIYYLSEEIIIHEQGASSKKKSEYYSVVMQRESKYYFFIKHYGEKKAWEFKVVTCIGALWRLSLLVMGIPVFFAGGADLIQKIREMIGRYINIFLWSIGKRYIGRYNSG